MPDDGVNRKLAAILSADVEGYSHLINQDEIGTIRKLNDHRDLFSRYVQQHKGRIVDTPGDNILVEFPSVSNAVKCAVEIQQELAEQSIEVPSTRNMQWRIGISVGDVVEEEGKIYGNGVNIAARVEKLAEAGGICVSGTAHDHVKGKLGLDYESIGEHLLKNIPDPIIAYRVSKQRRIAPGKTKPVQQQDKPTIAVLAFENMSSDPEQEYFSDGIAEDILNGLARNSKLDIIARTSSFQFKGENRDVRKIGKQLNATHILEGSVRKAGNRIRVTAQLINADKGTHIWSEQYNREQVDVFALQDEITGEILRELNVRLIDTGKRRIPTRNMAAYDAYLLGNYWLNQFRLSDSLDSFRKATSLDPNYADAYGGFAIAQNAIVWMLQEPTRNRLPLIAEYVGRALTLDPTQPEALVVQSGISFFVDHNYQRAINSIANLLTTQPSNHNVLAYCVFFFLAIGRGDLALRVSDRFVDIDPP